MTVDTKYKVSYVQKLKKSLFVIILFIHVLGNQTDFFKKAQKLRIFYFSSLCCVCFNFFKAW